jgi:hypothetical protein
MDKCGIELGKSQIYSKMLSVSASGFGDWIMMYYFIPLHFLNCYSNKTFNKGTDLTLWFLDGLSNISQLLT